jgi:hypothetical protein
MEKNGGMDHAHIIPHNNFDLTWNAAAEYDQVLLSYTQSINSKHYYEEMDKRRRLSEQSTAVERCVTGSGGTKWLGRYLKLDCIVSIHSLGQLLVIFHDSAHA